MKITGRTTAQANPNPHKVDARRLYDGEHAQVVHIELKPGERLKKHITPVDALFYVLEGNCTVEIGGETGTAGPGNLVESPANIPHLLANDAGEGIVRVLVMKIPRPTAATRLL